MCVMFHDGLLISHVYLLSTKFGTIPSTFRFRPSQATKEFGESGVAQFDDAHAGIGAKCPGILDAGGLW